MPTDPADGRPAPLSYYPQLCHRASEKFARNCDFCLPEGYSIVAVSIDSATINMAQKLQITVINTPGLAINVDSKDGVVTLSGEVESSTEKEMAGRIASNVNGTESVLNQLIVEPTQ